MRTSLPPIMDEEKQQEAMRSDASVPLIGKFPSLPALPSILGDHGDQHDPMTRMNMSPISEVDLSEYVLLSKSQYSEHARG